MELRDAQIRRQREGARRKGERRGDDEHPQQHRCASILTFARASQGSPKRGSVRYRTVGYAAVSRCSTVAPVQRLFSMFPPGMPGLALLLLRASVAMALLLDSYGHRRDLSGWLQAPQY